MRGIIKKIASAPKSYLERVGFTIRENKAKYVKRLWGDGLAAVAFSVISIVLICFREADMIVLTLNILCLFRTMLNNTISATKITLRNDGVDIVDKNKNYVYYHVKAAVYAAGLICITVAWVSLFWSEGNSNLLIKLFSILPIIAVLFNDLENDFVCAYGAIINPMT